ncbi:DUF3592 domain-containing protein [Hymenobacter chitinivorans]|uniref:DUF3592 domain-containing protein n=1 Tax=Hymenobacter chitinivorans DSM 11115 TaxID=1121954 RepID=A0A2M9AS68_9BACT|nr:DUF3592 domain-containing protein [Hymenobacter chitinivorans]PJJ48539.1 hypothetical protein CLV45_4248 [Hymenobacter chitinivorans DSM 11115]
MLQNLFRLLGRVYRLLWTCILVALLSVATLLTWHFYQQEHLAAQLNAGGQPVTVRVERADRAPRALWDGLGNFVYVGFRYQGRPYETRFVNDTLWLSEGDRVTLLYQPRLDVFGQAPVQPVARPDRVVSRLIGWTAVADFTRETKALALFILVSVALFFVGSGLLASLTGLTVIQALARGVLVICLGMGALFFTYNTVQYYRYAAQLQRHGQPMEVTVVDTDRVSHGRRTSWYTYQATFRFKGQERVVPIERADFERLNAQNSRLAVRYDPTLNDFISADYDPGLSELVPPLFLGLLLVLAIRPVRPRPVVPAAGGGAG